MPANESWLDYWSLARSLGMSDAEFRKSTVAKVEALRDKMDGLDRRRDFFVAYAVSLYLSSKGSRSSAEDILKYQYPPKPVKRSDYGIPSDVMGIQGDWQRLRTSMHDRDNRPTGRKY